MYESPSRTSLTACSENKEPNSKSHCSVPSWSGRGRLCNLVVGCWDVIGTSMSSWWSDPLQVTGERPTGSWVMTTLDKLGSTLVLVAIWKRLVLSSSSSAVHWVSCTMVTWRLMPQCVWNLWSTWCKAGLSHNIRFCINEAKSGTACATCDCVHSLGSTVAKRMRTLGGASPWNSIESSAEDPSLGLCVSMTWAMWSSTSARGGVGWTKSSNVAISGRSWCLHACKMSAFHSDGSLPKVINLGSWQSLRFSWSRSHVMTENSSSGGSIWMASACVSQAWAYRCTILCKSMNQSSGIELELLELLPRWVMELKCMEDVASSRLLSLSSTAWRDWSCPFMMAAAICPAAGWSYKSKASWKTLKAWAISQAGSGGGGRIIRKYAPCSILRGPWSCWSQISWLWKTIQSCWCQSQ